MLEAPSETSCWFGRGAELQREAWGTLWADTLLQAEGREHSGCMSISSKTKEFKMNGIKAML